jgi:hypothetical protein
MTAPFDANTAGTSRHSMAQQITYELPEAGRCSMVPIEAPSTVGEPTST